MDKKRNIHILVLLLLLFCGAGCRRFANPFTGDKLLAKVGDQTLNYSDVKMIFTPGITPEDSIALLDSYVDMWVKKQLKIDEAEKLFPESVPDIERMVEEYRNSLLSVKLDNYWVEVGADTVFTAKEIQEYYQSNMADFVLDRDIVKGRIVRVPDNYRQRARLKEMMGWASSEHETDFMEMCRKNNFKFDNYTSWTDYSEFLAQLPASRGRTDAQILSTESVQEIHDGDQYYYFLITSRRTVGSTPPLERVEESIKRVLANRRRAEVIRSREDSIFTVAKDKKQIMINVE